MARTIAQIEAELNAAQEKVEYLRQELEAAWVDEVADNPFDPTPLERLEMKVRSAEIGVKIATSALGQAKINREANKMWPRYNTLNQIDAYVSWCEKKLEEAVAELEAAKQALADFRAS